MVIPINTGTLLRSREPFVYRAADETRQLSEYLDATGAPRGAIVYMTSGAVRWVSGCRAHEGLGKGLGMAEAARDRHPPPTPRRPKRVRRCYSSSQLSGHIRQIVSPPGNL